MKGIEKQKKLFRYGVFLTALPLSFASFSCGRGKTDASAADQYFEGTSVACVSALRETPVGIESARISFGVPRYGVQSYGKEAPSFQATYVFYNPTDKDETLSLAFPYELIGRGYGREEEREIGRAHV